MFIAVGLFLIAQAVPPPNVQRSADCVHPVYASDQLVCADPELRATDARLAAAMAYHVPLTGKWIEDGESWFRRSRMCAMKEDHRACLVSAYGERLALEDTRTNAQPSKACGHFRLTSTAGGSHALFSADGHLVLLARPVTAGWAPFVGILIKGRRMVFLNGQGHALVQCQW